MIASRLARRVLIHSVRPVARVSAPSGRRFASTSAGHATKQSNDTPWIVRFYLRLSLTCIVTRARAAGVDWLCTRFRARGRYCALRLVTDKSLTRPGNVQIAYLLFGAQDKAKHSTAEHHAKPQPSISTEPSAKEEKEEEEPGPSEVNTAAGQEVVSGVVCQSCLRPTVCDAGIRFTKGCSSS